MRNNRCNPLVAVLVTTLAATPALCQTAVPHKSAPPPPAMAPNTPEAHAFEAQTATPVYLTPEEEQREHDLSQRALLTEKAALKALAENAPKAERLLKQAITARKQILVRLSLSPLTTRLAELYLSQNRNQEALQTLLGTRDGYGEQNFNADVALAYNRLGYDDLARQYLDAAGYSLYFPPAYRHAMPSIQIRRGVEACCLITRARQYGSDLDSLPDLQAAYKLFPSNPIIARFIADALLSDAPKNPQRYQEALPYLDTVAQNGNERMAYDAKGAAYSIRVFDTPEQQRDRRQAQEAQAAKSAATPPAKP